MNCSFCGKDQNKVGKLISSPHDNPRAFICDQCIAVCVDIIREDTLRVQATQTGDRHNSASPDSLTPHPLAAGLFDAVLWWMKQESLGNDCLPAMAQMRKIATLMLSEKAANDTSMSAL